MDAFDESGLGLKGGAGKTCSTDMLLGFGIAQTTYINRQIQFADTKAGVTLVATSGILDFLLKRPAFLHSLHGILPLTSHPPVVNASAVSAAIAFLLLLIASVIAFLVILPRTGGIRIRPGRARRTGSAVVFWGDVASFPVAGAEHDYQSTVSTLSPSVLVKGHLRNVYEISRICATKMHLLRWALMCAGVAFIAACGWELLVSYLH